MTGHNNIKNVSESTCLEISESNELNLDQTSQSTEVNSNQSSQSTELNISKVIILL